MKLLYVPMFKGRRYEHRVMKDKSKCFSDSIIPVIEILHDHYRSTDFATDPVTGEFLKKRAGKLMQRYRVAPTENDRDTLQYYNDLVAAKKAFIDYFRFSTDVYGRSIKASAVELSLRINQNESLYIEKLLEIEHYENLIPVLSIKKGFFPQKYGITDLIVRLQSSNRQIAIRLDDLAFEAFFNTVAPVLRNEDYVMYDIGEQNTSSKEIELEEFNSANTPGRKIVLNSPRKRDVKNSDYENREYTGLINNSARDISEVFPAILGFGDYCGLKDNLPSNQTIIHGAALALFYQYGSNQFMAYVNRNTDDGVRGYFQLIPQILEDSAILDPLCVCPAIDGVRQLHKQNRSGSWGNWNEFNMIRYLVNMYENI